MSRAPLTVDHQIAVQRERAAGADGPLADLLVRIVREALLTARPSHASLARIALDELRAMASQVALQSPYEALQAATVIHPTHAPAPARSLLPQPPALKGTR